MAMPRRTTVRPMTRMKSCRMVRRVAMTAAVVTDGAGCGFGSCSGVSCMGGGNLARIWEMERIFQFGVMI